MITNYTKIVMYIIVNIGKQKNFSIGKKTSLRMIVQMISNIFCSTFVSQVISQYFKIVTH